jgi:hypothetical protein
MIFEGLLLLAMPAATNPQKILFYPLDFWEKLITIALV